MFRLYALAILHPICANICQSLVQSGAITVPACPRCSNLLSLLRASDAIVLDQGLLPTDIPMSLCTQQGRPRLDTLEVLVGSDTTTIRDAERPDEIE